INAPPPLRENVPLPGLKSPFENRPVVSTFPLLSTVIEPLEDPPRDLAHTKLPLPSSLLTKTLPAAWRLNTAGPGSKSPPLGPHIPVVWTLPVASSAIPTPRSSPLPPSLPAQTKLPSVSSLQTNMSSVDKLLLTTLVRISVPLLGSKSQVPLKKPVMNKLPVLSTTMSLDSW